MANEPTPIPPQRIAAPFDRFLITAEQIIADRPEVDPDLTREIFSEVATLLYNGLALDGLDEHDARIVVAGLCTDLVAGDPAAAVRNRAEQVRTEPGEEHDPATVAGAYEFSARILQL